ncbi:oligosaccharide flippase family protein [Flavobacterium sp. J49]|uniref:oligosaccharide flippase family protein n=1 Tax=Flavobacterium sp. J49 TaxID=2718534 RepID=UPI00159400A9|nr:oligosaccharide flippase family protein [Flavobacterium sp. J49]MBF6641020.1 oligosaccharide flippase family protein [Flavobacterium sp. J49]NIC02267.1 oligosaccharide flippase family protein [Flavobacterium sp. J49]
MGIVQNQSIKNTIITFLGFGIGAVNALFFYTIFLGKTHYGIVTTILSGANIMMPLMAFGAQNTLIRFFSSYKDQKERDEFLTFILFLPLALIIPIGVIFYSFYDQISHSWIEENPTLKPFFWLIPLIGLFMAYFEVFYAWAKVHMKSVTGNFISEVLVRSIVMALLICVHFNWLAKDTFVYCVALAYFAQMIAMKLYAISIKMPVLRFVIPKNIKEIVRYSAFIIVSGGVAVMLVDFDKVMIPQYKDITQNALYSVAIFIATVIAVPSRAMTQIIAPITAKLMVENKHDELNDLYKKSAINLQVIGGFIMILIFVNIKEMYLLIPKDYSGGIAVVFMIGLSKFYDVLLGNNNSIIVNTKYYRTVLLFGIFTVVLMIILNAIFIPLYDIEGAAFATLITVAIYNTIKLLFVVKKMDLYPFTIKTLHSLAILAVCFLLFYFWDFPFHAIVNIGLKSILLSGLYVLLIYKTNLSEDINRVIEKILKIFRLR